MVWDLEIKRSGRKIYFSLPILKICLPQEAQVPLMAGLPFFSLICLGFLISRFFFFSYTQYPVTTASCLGLNSPSLIYKPS